MLDTSKGVPSSKKKIPLITPTGSVGFKPNNFWSSAVEASAEIDKNDFVTADFNDSCT